MEKQTTETFYISKKGGHRVKEIRTKFYISNNVKFLIQQGNRFRYVSKEEFYSIPDIYQSIKLE